MYIVPVVSFVSKVLNHCCEPVVQFSKVSTIRNSWKELSKNCYCGETNLFFLMTVIIGGRCKDPDRNCQIFQLFYSFFKKVKK